MSKVTAINIIINKKNQLNRYKELHLSTVGIEDILMWLNNIQKELEEEWQEEIKLALDDIQSAS